MVKDDTSGVQCNDDEEEDRQSRDSEKVSDVLAVNGRSVEMRVLMLATEVGVLSELLRFSSGNSKVRVQRRMRTGEFVDHRGREMK